MSLGPGLDCDPLNSDLMQYIEKNQDFAYCDGELKNSGRFDLIDSDKYSFHGKVEQRTSYLGIGTAGKRYHLKLHFDEVLQMSYDHVSQCGGGGMMFRYYVRVPTS